MSLIFMYSLGSVDSTHLRFIFSYSSELMITKFDVGLKQFKLNILISLQGEIFVIKENKFLFHLNTNHWHVFER